MEWWMIPLIKLVLAIVTVRLAYFLFWLLVILYYSTHSKNRKHNP